MGRLLFRFTVSGLENLPRDPAGRPVGGWICAGVPHRTWVEPFSLLALMPAEPRIVVLGDGPTMARSWWRRLLARALGGLIPIWPGGGSAAFERHARTAEQSLAAGAVFALFPEVGPPVRLPQLRRLSRGVGHIALRSGAPIVPVVFGGTDELFLRRRIIVRVLPAIDPMTVLAAPGPPREAVGRLMALFEEAVQPAVAQAHAHAQPRAGSRRIWRWLSGPYPRAD